MPTHTSNHTDGKHTGQLKNLEAKVFFKKRNNFKMRESCYRMKDVTDNWLGKQATKVQAPFESPRGLRCCSTLRHLLSHICR